MESAAKVTWDVNGIRMFLKGILEERNNACIDRPIGKYIFNYHHRGSFLKRWNGFKNSLMWTEVLQNS